MRPTLGSLGQIPAWLPAENERLYSEGVGLLRGYLSEEPEVAIDLSSLKSERDRLKDNLREIEGELRRLEAELKGLRQREIATKREIEALATLIELGDAREGKPGD